MAGCQSCISSRASYNAATLKGRPWPPQPLRTTQMLNALRYFGWPLLVGLLVALLIIERYP
ncbi:hypothetical protein, partial [Stutzerimonas balearica]|uniref:hypothetical protein n=1 Tax=Stutzerimonas balearica TaxID=74829 RepID=UPI00241D98F1